MNNESNNICLNSNNSESMQLLKSWLELNINCSLPDGEKIFSGTIMPESQ